jgi:hypothetical protein
LVDMLDIPDRCLGQVNRKQQKGRTVLSSLLFWDNCTVY